MGKLNEIMNRKAELEVKKMELFGKKNVLEMNISNVIRNEILKLESDELDVNLNSKVHDNEFVLSIAIKSNDQFRTRLEARYRPNNRSSHINRDYSFELSSYGLSQFELGLNEVEGKLLEALVTLNTKQNEIVTLITEDVELRSLVEELNVIVSEGYSLFYKYKDEVREMILEYITDAVENKKLLRPGKDYMSFSLETTDDRYINNVRVLEPLRFNNRGNLVVNTYSKGMEYMRESKITIRTKDFISDLDGPKAPVDLIIPEWKL